MSTLTKKDLGVGAECEVGIRYLHPKNIIASKIPNPTKGFKLTGLIVQGKEPQKICNIEKICIIF